MKHLFFLAALLAAPALPAAAQDCAPCEIEGGSYHLRLPEGEGPHPVLIWYHGHRGNGASIHRSGGLEQDFLRAGYALLAPNGFERADGVRSYPARTGSPRDDIAFTFAALDAADARGALDRDRLYVGGFSAGGSMAWLMACEAGDRLAGMVSVAGALRAPNPTECDGLPLPVLHIHGWADGQVPFEGRAIRDWHQGSVWDSLARATARNGCRTQPDEITIEDGWRIRSWDASCRSGAPVRLIVHDGGHGLPRGWTARARAFFEGDE